MKTFLLLPILAVVFAAQVHAQSASSVQSMADYRVHSEVFGSINIDTLRSLGSTTHTLSDVELSLLRKGWVYDTTINIESGITSIAYRFTHINEAGKIISMLYLSVEPATPKYVTQYTLFSSIPLFMQSFAWRLDQLGFKGEVLHYPNVSAVQYKYGDETFLMQNSDKPDSQVKFQLEYYPIARLWHGH